MPSPGPGLSPGHTPLVINFGCPRSGGTYIQHLLNAGRGYASRKLPETDRLHPCQCDFGLLSLLILLTPGRPGEHETVLVRQIRHPLEIVESFYALRLPRAQVGGLAHSSDEEIVEWIRSDQRGVDLQRHAIITHGWEERFIEIRYELLDDPAEFAGFLRRLMPLLPEPEANRSLLEKYHAENWRKHSVRRGRLEMGITEPLVSPERRAWFTEQLADVMEAQGYD